MNKNNLHGTPFTYTYMYLDEIYIVVHAHPLCFQIMSSNPVHDEVYSIQYCVIKFVSEFSPGTSVSSTNKTDRHDINEILLKLALHTINQTKTQGQLASDYSLVY